jgi:apolipoprotein N-acyltransferase
VGYALSGVPAARALASWGGVALVSFAVVALTHLGVDLASALRARTPARAGRAVAGVALAAALCLVAATFRVEPRSTGMLRFALIQGNDLNRDLDANEQADRYIPRRHFDLAARLSGRYDLVVFPESSMDADPRHDPWLAERLAATARAHDAWVLTNAVTDHPDGRAVNLDLLYGPDGSLRGTYAKRHLVPFGEYVPFRRVLEPLIPQLDQIPRDFAPGHRAETFAVGRHRIGTVICFEIAFGPLVRATVRQGADVIVVSTNNRSYRRSAQAAQHLAISQMRAAETGRPVLHASINGITGVVDHTGRIVERTHLFVNSVTTGEVEGTTGETIYVRLGEWVPALSAAGLLAAAAATRRRRGLPPGPSVESPGPTER